MAFIKVLKEHSKLWKIRDALATKKDVMCSNYLPGFNRTGYILYIQQTNPMAVLGLSKGGLAG